MASTPTVSLRLPPGLAGQVAARGSERTAVICHGLARLYDLYWRGLADLRGRFSVAEGCLICDALNGCWMHDPISPRLTLVSEVSDAIALNQLDAKWEVDGPALTAKLAALNEWHAAAVVDAVHRFWASDLARDGRELVREVFGPAVTE